MAAKNFRNLDGQVMQLLRIRVARHGSSMEAEARAILVNAAHEPTKD